MFFPVFRRSHPINLLEAFAEMLRIFEAQRFWDLRRWKLAFQEQNKPITGWNTQYSTNEDYYTEQLIYTQEFRIRNYFWPILDKELYSNKNLVQNYGW